MERRISFGGLFRRKEKQIQQTIELVKNPPEDFVQEELEFRMEEDPHKEPERISAEAAVSYANAGDTLAAIEFSHKAGHRQTTTLRLGRYASIQYQKLTQEENIKQDPKVIQISEETFSQAYTYLLESQQSTPDMELPLGKEIQLYGDLQLAGED